MAGYTGDLKTISYQDMMEKLERIVQIAVKGMVS